MVTYPCRPILSTPPSPRSPIPPGGPSWGGSPTARSRWASWRAPFRISLPAISKHLKVLERAGLIARGRDAQWRPCRLRPGPLKEAADWIEHYRRFWEESLDRLDDYLKELQSKEKKHGRKK